MAAITEASSRKNTKPNPRHHPERDISSNYTKEEEETTRLVKVNLSALSLDEVPENPNSINLAAICKLDLSNNNLQNIPESVMARLVNVVVLDVHSNQLKWLPNSVGCLSKLKFLNLSGNLLRAIPKAIENCRRLEELNANFNSLTSLPETLGFELINLKKLSLNSNQLWFLPYSTSHLALLQTLDVRLNRLHQLPHDIHSLINLKTLNASQNFHNFQALPSSIGHLPALVELDISYNNIDTLPPSLGRSEALRKLCIEGNPLVSPPLEVAEMGLQAVKEFLKNEALQMKPTKGKKASWFKKHSRGGFRRAYDDVEEREKRFYGCTPIETVALPKYVAMISPRRVFSSSPKNYSYTKLV